MKKVLVLALACCIAISCCLVAVAEEGPTTIRVSYCAPDQNDAQEILIKCIYAAIDDFNAEHSDTQIEFTLYNANYDLQTQIVQVESVIAKGCDVLLFFACDTDGSKSIIQQAMDAGITVVDVVGTDAYIDFVDCVFYANDEEAYADLLDEWLDKRYEETGVKLEAGVMYGAMNQTPQLPRGDRRIAYAEANPDKAEILISGTANWLTQEAMAVTEDWLVANPSMNAIFVANTDMTIGVAQALKAAGKAADDFVVTTVDITNTSLTMVENDELDALCGLDINDQAVGLVDLAYKMYTGEFTDNTLRLETLWCIDKENVAEYREYSQAWNEQISKY